MISPQTPTEMLQQIIARDEAPVSASTVLRELNDPAARLFQAVQRYIDGLHVVAEQLLGPQTVAELDQADQYVRGLTAEPAWPTLRAHLLRHLLTVAGGRDLRTADDMAAVLDWRLSASRPPSQVRCPGFQAFHQHSMPIQAGANTWQSDPNLSPTSPSRSKITRAEVTARQPGLGQELIPPSLFAKSQYGGPPSG
jgi:hypothetical protein